MLEVRLLSISDVVRERITTCTDHARLDDWLDRAGTGRASGGPVQGWCGA
ncbi:hypothetical protein ACRJ4W_33450 [Streptomyces sp. GLT-R25]